MQIVKSNHDSKRGIYAKALECEPKSKLVKEIAAEMTKWLDETNGKFDGEFKSAFAIAHSQVADVESPYKLFVVTKDMLAPSKIPANSKQTLANYFFESQAIFNCEILEAPEKVKKQVPQRKINKDPKNPLKVEVDVEWVEKELDNKILAPEGCMSFPHRTEKNVERKYCIKVRYQYLKKFLGIAKVYTFEGWVEGLKAHVIQHECDHFNAKNIYFKS